MDKRDNAQVNKGALAEECLREYFRSLGSFVLRGVPVREGRETITDVDLWIYTRPTAHIRHVSIVDIKNRKRSKSFERVIWVKGLQRAIGADEAILASKGLSQHVQEFSKKVGVRVVSQSIFEAVLKRYAVQENRLSTEELDDLWKNIKIGKTTLRKKMETVKAEIPNGMDFRTLNTWLDDAAFMVRAMIEREPTPGPITRGFFLCSALVALAADYLGRTHSFSPADSRENYFREGMVYGRHDVDSRKAFIEFTESAVTDFLDSSGASAAKVRTGIENAIREIPVQGLAEFFSRPQASTELWTAALALEESCHAKIVSAPKDLQCVEAKKVIGLISDYADVKRRDVLGSGGQKELDQSIAGAEEKFESPPESTLRNS